MSSTIPNVIDSQSSVTKIVPQNGTKDCEPFWTSLEQSQQQLDTQNTVGELFPSLPDVMLRKLCLLRENTTNIEQLSEEEINSRYQTLSLAFQTDKFTLDQRIRLFRHQRDVIESDAQNELDNLLDYVRELNRHLFSYDSKFYLRNNHCQLRSMLDRVEWQCQVIKSSVLKISSKCELYGAVRQEERLSAAFDVIRLHLDNLKRAKQRDEKELEEMRRLLARPKPSQHQERQNTIELLRQTSVCDDDGSTCSLLNRRAIQSITNTVANPKINCIRVRRASVASIEFGSKDVIQPDIGSMQLPSKMRTTTMTTTFENWPNGSATKSTTTVTTTDDTKESNSKCEQQNQTCTKTRRLSVPAADLAAYRPKWDSFSSQVAMVEEESGDEYEDLSSSSTVTNSIFDNLDPRICDPISEEEVQEDLQTIIEPTNDINQCESLLESSRILLQYIWTQIQTFADKLNGLSSLSMNRRWDSIIQNKHYDQIRIFASLLCIILSGTIIVVSILFPLVK